MPGGTRMKITIHHESPDYQSYRAACVRSLFNAEASDFRLEAELTRNRGKSDLSSARRVPASLPLALASGGRKRCAALKYGQRTPLLLTPLLQISREVTGNR